MKLAQRILTTHTRLIFATPRATTTLDIYIQEIPAAVRTAVKKLDAILTRADQDSDDDDTK
jgi:hypothetical protein